MSRRKIGNTVVASEALVSAGIWAYTFLRGSVNVIGSVEFHWPVFLYLAVLGIFGLVAINWDWIQVRRPKNKLYALADLATEIYEISRCADKEGSWESVNWGPFDLKLCELRSGCWSSTYVSR